jgi:hypothetical protein
MLVYAGGVTGEGTVLIVLIVMIAGLAGMTVFGLGMVNAGLRNGDRPGDARVTAWLARGPVVMVRVDNCGDVPLMAGCTARRYRVPGWAGGARTVRVPRRTARRRFRAARHEVVGVVAAGTRARFAVPAGTTARRYLLTVVIGQSGGRLRVFRLPVTDNDREPGGMPDWERAPQPF